MEEHNQNTINPIFRTILLYLVNGFCLGFVIWQTISCTTKYIDKPQLTKVSLKESDELPSSPAITICPKFGGTYSYNKTYLEDICGIELWRYEDYGKWASDNCSDPKQLLESIVYKPENVIEWGYFNEFESNEAQFYNNYDYENWYYFDDTDYVPCITLLTNNGIEQIILQLLVNSTINIHTPGMFLQGDGGQRRQHKYINLRDDHELHLDYEYHQLLDVDYGGVPCKKEKEYRKDLCTEKMIEKELIDKIGCTTPFVSNKSQICTEEDRGLQADNLARDLHHVKGSKCANPCSIFSFTTTFFKKSEFWSNGTYLRIKIRFPKNIKVFERSYTYSRLSLLAEIGGYVGLFLGISINQAINLLENLVAKLQFIYRHFSIIQMINLLDYLFTKLQWIYQHHLRF